MDRRFVDRTVVITGASRGLGEATARRFAAEGARVALAARSADALQATADSIGADRALAVPTDVTDLDALVALLNRAHQHFGRIDILVNNAGYCGRGRVIPWYGGWTADVGYLMPRGKRMTKPLLERIGRRHKRQYLKHTVRSRSHAGHAPIGWA